MKLSGHRIMGLGVLLMTSYTWLFPSLIWLVSRANPAGVPHQVSHSYAYSSDSIHLILIVYLLGAVVTILGGVIAVCDTYNRDPQSFTRFRFSNLWSLDAWAKRILALGIQFLLAPIWCLPFVNELAIKIAAEKVGYGSFLLFDSTCVGLQGETMTTLYAIGFYVTLAGIIVFVPARWQPRSFPMPASAL
jgi:hypothetical protein